MPFEIPLPALVLIIFLVLFSAALLHRQYRIRPLDKALRLSGLTSEQIQVVAPDILSRWQEEGVSPLEIAHEYCIASFSQSRRKRR